ncbi:MAG: hypothetical protein GYB67_00575 [Chloroflexi bacterium]|nr:hypothetical protein [Chloroflexota bacterium]
MKRIALLTLALLLTALTAAAQPAEHGEFWVQIFTDSNGNGIRDAGEPPLRTGVVVDLHDHDGVIIASQVIDEVPQTLRDRGLIGFENLPPGDYTIVVTTPDVDATTASRFDATIIIGEVPTVFEYGGTPNDATPVEFAAPPLTLADVEAREQIARVALAGIGAMLSSAVMTVLGILIYFMLRRRAARAHRLQYAEVTRTVRPVDPNLPR